MHDTQYFASMKRGKWPNIADMMKDGGSLVSYATHDAALSSFMSLSMSSTRHAVVLDESLQPCGYFPAATPSHHVEALTGMSAGIGGSALGFPIICVSRKNPVSGILETLMRSDIRPHLGHRQSSEVLPASFLSSSNWRSSMNDECCSTITLASGRSCISPS